MANFLYPPSSATIVGGATEAKQDDQITILTTIDADTSSISTDASTIAADTTSISTDASTIAADTTSISTDASTIAADTTSIDGKITSVDTDNVTIVSSTLPTGAATAANQSTANTSLSNIEDDINALNARLAGNLVPETFDEIELTYVGSTDRIQTVIYKLSTTIVATLTLSYDGSNRLSGVVKS